MEPRVSNLLLAEQSSADRHELDLSLHALNGNATGAVFPTTTLPAIRPLHEDHFLESRPYTNEIDSLTLPEIDWESLTASLNPNVFPPTSAIDTPIKPREKGKAGAPIAEVLNQASPDIRNAQRNGETLESESRKRRRLDAPPTRTLPRPSLSARKSSKRHPLLPPLLVPLHEPPPDAGLIPSINTDRPADKAVVQSAPRIEVQTEEVPPIAVGENEGVENDSPDTLQDESKPSQSSKGRRVRHSWTEAETADLLLGVAKFGIGSWKKILDFPDYKFNNRTAVDLKDRFRTCCPVDYRKAGNAKDIPPLSKVAEKAKVKSLKNGHKSQSPRVERPNKFEHKLPGELARLGISGPFPKAQRRARRGFSVEEDEAILRGFEKYGAKWTKIQSDQELDLSSRSRTDLRDRFRNKFPEKFVETGHKLKHKDGDPGQTPEETEAEAQSTIKPAAQVGKGVGRTTTSDGQPSPLSATDHQPVQNPIKLLAAAVHEPNYLADFGHLTDVDEPGPITLSRNIFDWADQNSRLSAPTSSSGLELSATITTMDQFHINPLLALKAPLNSAPSTNGANGHRDTLAGAPSGLNLFPQLPLSGILNGPVSLPSAAELASGLGDVEGGF